MCRTMKPVSSSVNYSQTPVEFQTAQSNFLLTCMRTIRSQALPVSCVLLVANICLVWSYTSAGTSSSSKTLVPSYFVSLFNQASAMDAVTEEPAVDQVAFNISCNGAAAKIIAQNFSMYQEQFFNQPFFLTRELATNTKSTIGMGLKHRPLPYGLKGVSPQKLEKVPSLLEQADLLWARKDQSQNCFGKCIVVGNGGILLEHKLGKTIDSYDAVIRINAAPTKKFANHVGRKTTIRFFYPESSDLRHLDDENMADTTLVMTLFSPSDLDWLDAVYKNSRVEQKKAYWKKTGDPREYNQFKHQIRILNPAVVNEAQKLLENISHARPTTGLVAIVFASKICNSVDIAGFAYDKNTPSARLHYYDRLKMGQMVCQDSVHNVTAEAELIRSLAAVGFMRDLSHGVVHNDVNSKQNEQQTMDERDVCKPYHKKKSKLHLRVFSDVPGPSVGPTTLSRKGHLNDK